MAFTPEQQASNAAAVKSVWWARLSVNHTKKVCCASLILPVLAIVIVIASGAFTLDTPGTRDYFVRNDIRTELNDAREAARDDFPYSPDGAPDVETPRAEENNGRSLTVLLRGRVGEDGSVGIFNETSDQAINVFTREGLALLKKAEDRIFEDEEYQKFCLFDPSAKDCDGNQLPCVLPQSILSSENLYGIREDGRHCGRKSGSEPVSEEDFNEFLNELIVLDEDSGQQTINPQFARYMGSDITVDDPETWVLQTILEVGEPFEGFDSVDDREEDQTELYVDWAEKVKEDIEAITTSRMDASVISLELIDASFGNVVFRDLSFSIVAIVLVFILIWIHTTSAYLAGSAMLQIFLAFPFTYAIYRFVFQQKYFSALQILVIFLLLGIGADDVFVFTDAWKQAAVVLGSDCDLVTRMSWTYRRSVRAMAVTSLTTAAAFFVNATSPIMPIGTLGIWAGLLVIFVFVLVITVYPCALVTWHRFWRVRMAVKCFQAPEPGKENETPPSIWSRCIPKKWRKEKEGGDDEYRTIEKFFRGPWFGLIRKLRYGLLILGVAIAGVAIYLATRLEPLEETEQFLPDDDPDLVALDTIADAFPRSDSDFQLRVYVTWGIKTIDRTGTSKFETDELGKAVLDDSFQLRRKETQQHILDACDFFADSDKNLLFDGPNIEPVECWIRDFLEWRNGLEGEEGFKDYENDAEMIAELERFGESENAQGVSNKRYLLQQRIGFKDDKIVFTEIRFVSPLEPTEPYNIMWPVYNDWQDELERLNNGAPETAKNAIATAGGSFAFQITQDTLVRQMFTGIGIMIGVSIVTLTVSTLNFVVALLTTLCIGGIVACLLGMIYLYGWQLGITEAIGVVIAIGYSFDGAAHIATAYVESKGEDRIERTRDALTDLGISILFGAISTLLAGFMLFPAIIIFFTKFAALIVTTVSLGLVWSLAFLPSLLMIVGPNKDFGSLKPFLTKLSGRFRKKRAAEAEEVPPEKIVDDGYDVEDSQEEGSAVIR